MRPLGLSAFVRCKNEEEYIVASLLSVYRVFDEIVVVLNNSTDRTPELVMDLIPNYPKIRIFEYINECAPIGPGYSDRVAENPSSSLASYYNWCLEKTSYSHVCKWDGDMVALPFFLQVREYIAHYDVINFDGYDVLGEHTTDNEPRIFRFGMERARYIDWDLYEVLQHDYSKVYSFAHKCYLHMKLVKKDWLNKAWSNPNLLATRSVPETGAHDKSILSSARVLLSRFKRILEK